MKSWRDRIAEARKRGGFLVSESELARDWAQCAVGEVASRYGLRSRWWGCPWGLTVLGCRFFGRVRHDDVAGAEMVLNAIEDRALQLKREQS